MPERKSAFALTDFFMGTVQASGLFEDRFGQIRRRFSVAMSGAWEGEAFLLRENFVYDDGETQHRVWRVVPRDAGGFLATADDIVGVVSGSSTADAILMRYRMRLNVEGRKLVLSFTDRIYRMDHEMAFSRAVVTKWGVKVGEVSITYRRMPGEVAKSEAATRAAA